MKLDGKELVNGSEVYHLTLGYGKVDLVSGGGATAIFNGQQLGFDNGGKVAGVDQKMVGLAKPVVVWGEVGDDVSKLEPLIRAGLSLLGYRNG